MTEEPTAVEAPAEETRAKKPSGAQRKKDTRERVKNEKGVWVLKDGWQPHPKVLRGKQARG